MGDDYRRTKYCPVLNNLQKNKQAVVAEVLKDHPGVQDIHTYISKNDERYKNMFMRAYNGKCSYCGVSLALIPKRMFEIDHFIYEKSPQFKHKSDAGYIENLVLACQDCNRNKSSFAIPTDSFDALFPDGEQITATFIRDEMYYIKIADAYANNPTIKEFYKKLKFGSELHRIDYLLMSLIGLQAKMGNDSDIYSKMGQAIELLRSKRNIMSC